MASKKIKAFSLSVDEQYLYVGNLSGELLTVSTDDLSILGRMQAHPGGIIAVSTHPTLPYIATLGMDRSVGLYKTKQHGRLEQIDTFVTRDITCDNDEKSFQFILSVSQALNFHPTQKKIVTRSGNAGVLELSFDTDRLHPIRCTRLHGKYDVVTVSYVGHSDKILSGSNHGEVILSENGTELKQWQFGHETIHWFEHLAADEYLIASDMRAVIKFSIEDKYEPIIWANISRDDLEHVTFNPVNGRAFATSFDRNVYEIDPATCAPIGVAYTTPFKNRWVKNLKKDPDRLIIQCRNGALYMVSLQTGQLLAAIRETPYALWSGDYDEDTVVIAGEGDKIMRIHFSEEDRYTRIPVTNTDVVQLSIDPFYYTKRLVYHPAVSYTILGRTNGELVALYPDSTTDRVYKLDSPVRDLAVVEDTAELFVATEDGKVHLINLVLKTTAQVYDSPRNEPIWAIAYNRERRLLAVAEREGAMLFINHDDYSIEMDDMDCHRPKRLKWLDKDRLYFSNGANLFCTDSSTWNKRCVLKNVGNTIEDFIWDQGKRYMIMVNYQRNLLLMDIQSGCLLQAVSDEIDYSKGALWLRNPDPLTGYRYDFITYGRSGRALLYRIHDEKIISLGPIPGIMETPDNAVASAFSDRQLVGYK